MADGDDIRRSIQAIMGSQSCAVIVSGVVRSVDEKQMTAQVALSSQQEDCISASFAIGEKGKGIVQEPKVGSMVLCVMLSKSLGFVVMTEQVQKIIINGGELGGLIKIEEMTKQLSKMTKRIDKIIDALKNSAVAVQDGGTTYKTNITAALQDLETEDFSEIEDKIITH